MVLSLREALNTQRRTAPRLETKTCSPLKPQTWNVPSDNDYGPTQHSSDGNQATLCSCIQTARQLWPDELQEACPDRGGHLGEGGIQALS